MISDSPNEETKKKELKKNYTFEHILKAKKGKEENEIVLSFNIILYEDEILFQVKETKDNLKTESSFYKKNYSLEELKTMSGYFSLLKNLDKIFESLKKNIGKNKDNISLEKDKVIIKLNINLDVIEEEIILNIPYIEKSETDEMNNIKETVIFLNEEKKNLKIEITKLKENEHNLNNTVEKLKEENKNLNNKVDSMGKELKEISKYMKEKLKSDDEEEKELQIYECIREKKSTQEEENNIIEKNTPEGKYISTEIFMIYIYLYNDKIKIRINEIQDNLKTNPLIYENLFVMNDFEKISKYYIKYKDIKAIYDFLCDLFKNNKDTLDKKDDNKIILTLTFPFGLKEEKIHLEILNKELSLDNTLKNLKQSINIINKNMQKDNSQINDIYKKMATDINELQKQTYNLKTEFQKDLLEKVHPIGSYYWSQKSTSPEEIFGGKWESIYGKFIFSTDSNHSVDSTGGEEKHTLTEDEMPSHNHGYQMFNYYSWSSISSGSYYVPYRTDSNFLTNSSTDNKGSSQAHNNMPPYITAYCWRRYQ